MLIAFMTDTISWNAFAAFLFVAIGMGVLLSASGMLLEEISFHIYPRGRELALLALIVVLENFGYRQLNTWWRLIGLFKWLVGSKGHWGAMKRKGWQKGDANQDAGRQP
jgi:hypothetical protein